MDKKLKLILCCSFHRETIADQKHIFMTSNHEDQYRAFKESEFDIDPSSLLTKGGYRHDYVKAWKNKDIKIFNNYTEFEEWKKNVTMKGEVSLWQYKYYKGFGSHTEKDNIM